MTQPTRRIVLVAEQRRSTTMTRIACLLALFAILVLSADSASAAPVVFTFTTDFPSPDSMSGTITATPAIAGFVFDRDVTATDLTITGPSFPTPLNFTLPIGISSPITYEPISGAVSSGSFLKTIDGNFIEVTILTPGVGGTTVSMSPAGGAVILGHFTASTLATVPGPSGIVMAATAIPLGLGYWWTRRRRATA